MLQGLQIPNEIYIVALINQMESIARELAEPGRYSQEEKLAIKWHYAKHYTIFVLNIPEPGAALIMDIYRTLYESPQPSPIEVRSVSIEHEIHQVSEAILDLRSGMT